MRQEGLSVTVIGSGHVNSSPGGIKCPGTCSTKLDAGTKVDLSALADAGSTFTGWSGDCSGTGSCSVTMSTTRSVTATFTTAPQQFILAVGVNGNGSVSSSPAGIACPTDCAQAYDTGTKVTLAPIAAAGATFSSWTGACSGAGICVVTVNEAKSATATFADRQDPPDQTRETSDTSDGDTTRVGTRYDLDMPFDCYSVNALFVDALYRDLLGRPADAAALALFGQRLDSGTPRTQIAQQVLGSLEYRTRAIQGFYAKFLKRQPTAQELAFALGLYATGGPEAVAESILGSTEYFTTHGGTNDGFLDALFQDLLGRPPTAAERASFELALTRGSSRTDVATDVFESDEARTKQIQGFFQDFLGRAPTQAEVSAFLAQLHGGASLDGVEAAILGSDEYAGGLGKYTAIVHWGDGTTTRGAVTDTNGRCSVDGTHSYSNEGVLTIMVDITSPDDSKTTFPQPLKIKPPPLPPRGRENAQPRGIVLIKIKGAFVPLRNFRVIPFGTELDTTKGSVRLTSHDGSSGKFFEGRFKLLGGSAGAKPLSQIVLTGGNYKKACGTTKRRIASAGKPKPKSVRHVWGDAKGHFRTKGKYASATIRGTFWKTDDLCTGTLVTVRHGNVDVLDLVKNTHHQVRSGHSYFAKKP